MVLPVKPSGKNYKKSLDTFADQFAARYDQQSAKKWLQGSAKAHVLTSTLMVMRLTHSYR
jgi:hypothetical protein